MLDMYATRRAEGRGWRLIAFQYRRQQLGASTCGPWVLLFPLPKFAFGLEVLLERRYRKGTHVGLFSLQLPDGLFDVKGLGGVIVANWNFRTCRGDEG